MTREGGDQEGLRTGVLAGDWSAAGTLTLALVATLGDPAAAVLAWLGTGAVGRLGTPEAILQALDRDIVAIDAVIGQQLDAILHHPGLQALEARWRSLHWLVEAHDDGPGARVVVRILDASWRAIARDLERAVDFDRSHLFNQIYEAHFGTAGGEPFGLIVIDHQVRHQPDALDPIDDRGVLGGLAQIAAAAFAPMILGAAPSLLGVDDFAALAATPRPAAPLEGPEHSRWRSLRELPDARFLAVVLPRVLARPAWPDNGIRGDGFRYRESVAHRADRLWASGAYAFAAVVLRAAARYGWPADIRGAEPDHVGGGLVTTLPRDQHRLSATLGLPRLPLEVVFTDQQERSLIEAGLMPVGALPFGEDLLFGAIRTLYRPPDPPPQLRTAAFADSQVAVQVNSILCASRFAHYLKVLGREMIGRARDAPEIEAELRRWLGGFVNRNILAEKRATHPLYDAGVRVAERADQPGTYDCAIDLQPYFQLDNVAASFKFETEIARAAG